MIPSYAVLFKTHFWDDFNQRQLERVRARIGAGDIYVVIDETFGPAPAIPHDKVVGVTEADFAANGLPPITTHGSIIWFNNDYANYVAVSKIPRYDYYVAIEYDAAINTDVEGLINRLAADGVDFLGFPIKKPASEWPWYPMLKDLYGPGMLVYLSCISVFSHRAITMLARRRQTLGEDFAAGTLRYWPNVEAFLPNEVRNADMRCAALGAYGKTEFFDWWPPMEEAELASHAAQVFIHPVLCGTRYIRSLIHHEPDIRNYFRRDSRLNIKLSGYDRKLVRPLLRANLAMRVRGKWHRTLEALGLRRKWYETARTGGVVVAQGKSVHNES